MTSQLLRRTWVLAAVTLTVACNPLDVTNPNAPDAERALTDPAAIEAIAGGTIRSFYNTYNGLEAVGPLTAQAESHTASWNNFNMNFYSSLDGDGTRNTRGWRNDPSASARTSIEHFWQGYYSTASSARDVLVAIRINNVEFDSESDTRRAEAIAELMLGASLGQIALNYDKGYFIDETVDLLTLQYFDRAALRDSAVAKLQSAAALATANAFVTPASWTNGNSYSNTQIAQLANTLAAMTLAYWPRNDTENAEVDWSAVAGFAAAGMTYDFVVVGDGCDAFCPQMQSWTNDIFGIRVHTRVANLLDPVTQADPFPDTLNTQPNSVDARLGDGSFGTVGMEEDYGTVASTVNAGTDFAWSSYEAFFPARGQYHQSNIAHIRWDESGTQDLNSIYSGYGPVPLIMRAQNDLIRAEALIRSGGSLTTAATLINNTRVTRGNLSAASAGDGAVTLKQYLDYENEIELLSQGASTFYNRRRVPNGLITGTPREMPVPAKELGVKLEPLYTFGGTGLPNSPTPP
jgi:hypothetical protein